MRIVAFCLLLLCCISWVKVEAKEILVCPDCPISSLGIAINSSERGDIIRVQKGTYLEDPMVISHKLDILGENYPVIKSANGEELFTVIADSVSISGLHLEGVGLSYLKEKSAIRIKKGKDFRIEDNILLNNFFGIYLEHAKRGIVKGNRVRGEAVEEASSGNAIHAWYCSHLQIDDNEVIGHRDGIYLEFVEHSSVTRNLSQDNIRYGLHFMFSDNDKYAFNVFKNNGAGVAVMFSRFIDMDHNEFIQNWGTNSYGLLLKEISDATIKFNAFTENTVGIFVEGSNRITYSKNVFKQNGWAVKIAGGCLDNFFDYNNFFQNTFEFSVFSSFKANRIEYNYWSEYAGYDLDRDGIGDVAHRPIKLFSFITQQCPESIVLLRSLFIDLMNFSEKISPIFTPVNVLDEKPLMFPYETELNKIIIEPAKE